MIWMKVASEESGFPPLFLQSIFPHVIGLKSAFEVVLSPVMHKPDMEHQASLPRRLSKVVMEFKSIYHQAAPDTLNDKPLIQAIP